MIDCTSPFLLKIGDNVVMTGPVTILTHDYSSVVCGRIHPEDERAIAAMHPVTIGNNVFIGWGATVLPGTTIGDNVIIGAQAVVKGRIEANSVYAGNPAKRITSVEEFYQRRLQNQKTEAYRIYEAYVEKFESTPPESCFSGYESLWNRNKYKHCSFGSFEEFCAQARGNMQND